MKNCLYCGRALPDNSTYCNYCGATQKSSPVKQQKKSSSSWLIIIVILVIICGVILVPVIAPDWANEKPEDLLLLGGGFFVIGVIAWLLEWSGKVRFVGRGSCCLFFPLIGLIVFLYGLFSFFTRSSGEFHFTYTTPVFTATYRPRPFSPPLPTYRSVSDDCTVWSAVTIEDKGKYLCVYGTVYEFYSLDEEATHIRFTSTPNTFFLTDKYYTYPDLRVGLCVKAYDTVRVFSGIPYMSISQLSTCSP